jgi:hypothetical protein
MRAEMRPPASASQAVYVPSLAAYGILVSKIFGEIPLPNATPVPPSVSGT